MCCIEHRRVLVSHLVFDRGTDGLIEELDADDRKETDAHGQDDGEPQVRLSQSVRRGAYGSNHNSQCEHNNPAAQNLRSFTDYYSINTFN